MTFGTEDRTQISTEILLRLGAIKHPSSSDQLMIKCLSPEHTDHHASMSVSLSKGICHCFACGYSKALTSVYYDRTGSSIWRDLGITLDSNKPLIVQAHRSKPRFLLPDAELQTDFILRYDEELSVKDSPLAIEWAKKRGFDLKFCDDMSFRFYNHFETLRRSDPSERPHSYYNCVVIPIYEKGSLVSFEARDVLGKERWAQKKHADGVEYKKVMYPLYSSVNTLYEWEKLKKEEPLYIVEGLMDMFSLRTSPYFKNSSCLFHCIPTERQLGILERFSSITYIIDNDKPGMKGCLKLMEQLPRGKVAFLRVPDRGGKVKDVNDVLQGKDPYIKTIDGLLKAGWMKRASTDVDVLRELIAL